MHNLCSLTILLTLVLFASCSEPVTEDEPTTRAADERDDGTDINVSIDTAYQDTIRIKF